MEARVKRINAIDPPEIWLNVATSLLIGPLTSGSATFQADFFDGNADVAEVGETQSSVSKRSRGLGSGRCLSLGCASS